MDGAFFLDLDSRSYVIYKDQMINNNYGNYIEDGNHITFHLDWNNRSCVLSVNGYNLPCNVNLCPAVGLCPGIKPCLKKKKTLGNHRSAIACDRYFLIFNGYIEVNSLNDSLTCTRI